MKKIDMFLVVFIFIMTLYIIAWYIFDANANEKDDFSWTVTVAENITIKEKEIEVARKERDVIKEKYEKDIAEKNTFINSHKEEIKLDRCKLNKLDQNATCEEGLN